MKGNRTGRAENKDLKASKRCQKNGVVGGGRRCGGLVASGPAENSPLISLRSSSPDLSSLRACSLRRRSSGFRLFSQEAVNKRGVGAINGHHCSSSRKNSCFAFGLKRWVPAAKGPPGGGEARVTPNQPPRFLISVGLFAVAAAQLLRFGTSDGGISLSPDNNERTLAPARHLHQRPSLDW